MSENTIPCPLCKASNTVQFYKSENQLVFRCTQCQLLFKDSNGYMSSEAEKSRYSLHNNDTKDPNYLNYLNTLWKQRPEGEYDRVVDFGCGPTKGLQAVIGNKKIDSYDPLFYPIKLSKNHYDLVFCCEVVEHFNHPLKSWYELTALLKNNGILLVRTETYDGGDFAKWYYKDDPTHVCFYSCETFNWLSKNFNLVLLKKSGSNIFVFKNARA